MSLFVPPVNSNYFNITTCFMVTGKGSRMFKLSWSTACHTWMSCSVAAGLFWYTTSTEARLVRHLRPNKVYSWHLKNRKKRVKCLSTWCISSSLSGYWEPTGSLLRARVSLVLFHCALWLVETTHTTLSTSQMQNKNKYKSSIRKSPFPQLEVGYCFFELRALISSL